LNVLIFGIDHERPWSKKIQVGSNEVPGIPNGPVPGRYYCTIV